MARSPLALGTASGRSKPLNAARLLNLYAEPAPQGSMSQWVLYGTPGQKVVIYGEQGVGDEIMAMSMLPDAMERADIVY